MYNNRKNFSNFFSPHTFISATEVNDSVTNGASALDKTKQDLNQLASDASGVAEKAKETGGTALDHAKGAANAAMAAGSKAVENIVEQKLKDAENVIGIICFRCCCAKCLLTTFNENAFY